MPTARPKVVLFLILFLPSFAGLGLLCSAQELPSRTAQLQASFDVPLKKQKVDFGPSPYYDLRQKVRKELTCYFYPTFIVKEYDEGQKGDEWMAIAPVEERTAPACTLTHTPNEKVITYPEWSGYFLGAKGRLVFFREADGINMGMPFVVYDSQTKAKVFEEDSYHDTAIFMQKEDSSPFNHMRVIEGRDGQFTLKYLRVIEADCDLHSEKSSCLERVRKKLKLQTTEMPTCIRYESISTWFASAVAYPVEVTLFPKPVMRVIEGPVRCWPGD